MSRLFEEMAKQREERRKANCKPEILERVAKGDPVEFEEYHIMLMNSWERELLYPLMTTDCLIQLIEKHILPNCQKKSRTGPSITYDENLIHDLVPLLLDRLKESGK